MVVLVPSAARAVVVACSPPRRLAVPRLGQLVLVLVPPVLLVVFYQLLSQ